MQDYVAGAATKKQLTSNTTDTEVFSESLIEPALLVGVSVAEGDGRVEGPLVLWAKSMVADISGAELRVELDVTMVPVCIDEMYVTPTPLVETAVSWAGSSVASASWNQNQVE